MALFARIIQDIILPMGIRGLARGIGWLPLPAIINNIYTQFSKVSFY
jgi:hypothetical protein